MLMLIQLLRKTLFIETKILLPDFRWWTSELRIPLTPRSLCCWRWSEYSFGFQLTLRAQSLPHKRLSVLFWLHRQYVPLTLQAAQSPCLPPSGFIFTLVLVTPKSSHNKQKELSKFIKFIKSLQATFYYKYSNVFQLCPRSVKTHLHIVDHAWSSES